MNRNDARGCRSQRHLLLTYVDGDATSEERLTFESHLDACPSCQEALVLHLHIEETLHKTAGIDPDPDFEDRIVAGAHKRIDEQATEERARKHRRIRLLRRVATAGTVAMAAGIAVILFRSVDEELETPHQPEIEQARLDTPRPLPAEDQVDPKKLDTARERVRSALVSATDSDDYQTTFGTAVSDLKSQGWPVERIITRLIHDPDPETARVAIQGAGVLGLKSAVPSLRRVVLNRAVQQEALFALAALDSTYSSELLEKALADKTLSGPVLDGFDVKPTSAQARMLGDAILNGANNSELITRLLQWDDVGVAEVLRLANAGHRDATRTLSDRGLPRDGQLLTFLDPESGFDSEIVTAAILYAHQLGDMAIPLCEPFLDRTSDGDSLALASREALITIGSEKALYTLLRSTNKASKSAAHRLIEETLHPTDLILAASRDENGLDLVAFLNATNPIEASCLEAVLRDEEVRDQVRAKAALLLAAADRLDPTAALSLVALVTTTNPRAGALLLCAAARAGADRNDSENLPQFSRSDADSLLKRAVVIANRWKDDGSPPHPWEEARLVRLLANTVSKL